LPPDDALAASEYLVVPQLDAGRTEGRIFWLKLLNLPICNAITPICFRPS
jgi:hypothetical protein